MSDYLFGIVTGVCVTVCGALLADAAIGAGRLRRRIKRERDER